MAKHTTQYLRGVLSKHKRGYGFVVLDDREETGYQDIFIPPDNMGTAMHGDSVTVMVDPAGCSGQSLEGKIVKVLSRAMTRFVGTFSKRGGYGYVKPENSKLGEEILIKKKDWNGSCPGDKVMVKITCWPVNGKQAEGKIIEIISRKDEAGGDIKALIRSFQIQDYFPEKVIKEIGSIAQSVVEKDLKCRKDLRGKNIFTLDGADAKDLDDAVSVERLKNGSFLLGVHIADVSNYVQEGSLLDREALKRSTSIYLIDRVIPMLPQGISNGICSLNPNQDRLTLSVFMEIDMEGKVISHDICESVICSKERLVYTDVSDILELDDKDLKKRYKDILPDLMSMDELADILRKKRMNRGSLDFDFDEAFITLNKEGIPISVDIAERRIANRIIEEFMIITNETVAEHFYHMQLPFIYRIHEKPSVDKIEEFQRFLLSLGIRLKGSPENVHPKTLNDILSQVAGKENENVVNTVMLRSMKKAFYGTRCLGHFGLGIEYYCHFTAPIRRYPDLIIHRVIKETLKGSIYGERLEELKKKTEENLSVELQQEIMMR